MDDVALKFPISYENSMNTILQQELMRFNALLVMAKQSLSTVKRAVNGLVVMTQELERLATSLLNGQVPQMWKAVSYPTLKPLSSYVADLVARISFLSSWITNGQPRVYWISGFFFTQSFLTGTRQNHARKYGLDIDTISFDFFVRREMQADDIFVKSPKDEVVQGGAGKEELAKEEPYQEPVLEDSCLIYGLFMDGARWRILPLASAEGRGATAVGESAHKENGAEAKPKAEPVTSEDAGNGETEEVIEGSARKVPRKPTGYIDESLPQQLFFKMPIIALMPSVSADIDDTRHQYSCPVYKTTLRRGTLSTTGHSTNYVMAVQLPMDQKHSQRYWVKRGVAMVCSLDE